jgi:hypothetical protein
VAISKPSWHLKLLRAEEHLIELYRRVEPFSETHDYTITQDVEQNGEWTYRAWTQIEPDPYLSVVLGDFLFNIRSALDHIAVSLVPAKHQGNTFFPIFTVDPEEAHPNDIKADVDRRRSWKNATTGMPSDALDIIRAKQPYNVEVSEAYRSLNLQPRDHVLEVLREFQNADKHRQLITMVRGLNPQSVTVTDPTTGEVHPFDTQRTIGHIPQNGAELYRGKPGIDVKAEGTAEVAAGIRIDELLRGPYRKIPDFPIELLRIAWEISDLLDGLA